MLLIGPADEQPGSALVVLEVEPEGCIAKQRAEPLLLSPVLCLDEVPREERVANAMGGSVEGLCVLRRNYRRARIVDLRRDSRRGEFSQESLLKLRVGKSQIAHYTSAV